MANPTKLVIDLSQPKGQRESIVELTAEEIAERTARAEAAAAEEATRQQEEADKAAAAATGRQKLADLGLTDAEIDALLS